MATRIRLTPAARRTVTVTDPDNSAIAVNITTPPAMQVEAVPDTVDVNIGPMVDTHVILQAGGGTGPTGPAGPEGPAGPQGPPGGTYTHTQGTPAAVWAVTHNLGYRPAVSAQDSAGTLVYGNVTYLDENRLTIEFDAAFSGRADVS